LFGPHSVILSEQGLDQWRVAHVFAEHVEMLFRQYSMVCSFAKEKKPCRHKATLSTVRLAATANLSMVGLKNAKQFTAVM
jgi:hypothetical protein